MPRAPALRLPYVKMCIFNQPMRAYTATNICLYWHFSPCSPIRSSLRFATRCIHRVLHIQETRVDKQQELLDSIYVVAYLMESNNRTRRAPQNVRNDFPWNTTQQQREHDVDRLGGAGRRKKQAVCAKKNTQPHQPTDSHTEWLQLLFGAIRDGF